MLAIEFDTFFTKLQVSHIFCILMNNWATVAVRLTFPLFEIIDLCHSNLTNLTNLNFELGLPRCHYHTHSKLCTPPFAGLVLLQVWGGGGGAYN